MSISTSTTHHFNEFLGDFYSRRLLLQAPISPLLQNTPSTTPSITIHDSLQPTPIDNNINNNNNSNSNTFDANVVMVLSVLLCALICSLGLNAIFKCALRCSRLVSSNSSTSNISSSTRQVRNEGVNKKALNQFTTITFSVDNYNMNNNMQQGLDTECVICLSEFVNGDRVKLLPKCNHGFHVKCIDKWLSFHSSCPTCRHSLIENLKIVGCDQASTSETNLPVQERILTIVPLEQEGYVCNYRAGSS